MPYTDLLEQFSQKTFLEYNIVANETRAYKKCKVVFKFS